MTLQLPVNVYNLILYRWIEIWNQFLGVFATNASKLTLKKVIFCFFAFFPCFEVFTYQKRQIKLEIRNPRPNISLDTNFHLIMLKTVDSIFFFSDDPFFSDFQTSIDHFWIAIFKNRNFWFQIQTLWVDLEPNFMNLCQNCDHQIRNGHFLLNLYISHRFFPVFGPRNPIWLPSLLFSEKNSLERKDKAILPSIKLTFGSSSIVILNLDLWTLAPRTGYARGARIWTQKLLYLKITVNYWQATSIKNDFNNLILFY